MGLAVGTRGAAQDTARMVTPCDGRPVSAVHVQTREPYYAGFRGQWRPLARTLASLHATTRPEVIRSLVALHVGDLCTEVRRVESERILRAQPFLSEARVMVYDDHTGGVRIEVFAADEISVLGALSARSAAPHIVGLRLGDGNLAGEGVRVVGEWADGMRLRDHYGGLITDYAVAGHPYQLTVRGNRDPLGGDWSATLVHPFFTDLQRWAWIAEAGELRTYVSFLTPSSEQAPTLDFSRHFVNVGALTRIGGGPGNVRLVGLSISQESETPGSRPLLVGDSIVPFTDSALVARYAPLKSARINALVGVRDASYLTVRGFDALNGEQDVQRGIQVGGLVGRGVRALGATSNDVLLASTLLFGTGTPRSYVALQASGQARHDQPTGVWDDILTTGRLAWYWKPISTQTVISSTEYGLGLNQRLPFELTLADLRGGVRGFHGSEIGGGERLVSRLEDRWLLGPVQGLGELGLAGFVDAGRLWAQGVPNGVNSPTEVGVGLSILAAVPIHSRRLWRVDFAVPVTHDPTARRYEVRLSTTFAAGPFYLEPRDLTRARERSVPTSIFQYPAQ